MNLKKISKLITIPLTITLSLCLCACGGQQEREPDIPTADEATEYAVEELGIRGAEVLDVRDVRSAGADYYEIDAIYTMKCDCGVEFTLLRSYDYDTLFGSGYHYGWISDYGDAVISDYLRDHPLPEGVFYSDASNTRYNYGAHRYFGDADKQIWFDFSSDEEYDEYLSALEPWLEDWLGYERQFTTKGKDPHICVAGYRAQDETMKYSICVYRCFGYDRDSFHAIGEDGETYRWISFREAMESGYEAQKRLMMK